MKKIYSLLVLLMCIFAGGSPLFAQNDKDASVILDVDDITRVVIKDQDGNELSLHNGENTFEFSTTQWYTLIVSPRNADCQLTSVTRYKPDGMGGYIKDVEEELSLYVGEATLSINTNRRDYKWVIQSYSYNDIRTAKCTIKIDNPEKVAIMRKDYSMIEGLQAGENIVKFIPEGAEGAEVPFVIQPMNINYPLYKVVLNGREVAGEWGFWSITPNDGDQIEVYAEFPGAEVSVKLVPADEESKGFIESVQVNDTDIPANQWESGFTANVGDNIYFYGNTTDYEWISTVVNPGTASEQTLFNFKYFIETEGEKVITYKAKKHPDYEITIHVDHADHVAIYKESDLDENNRIALVDGENKVVIPNTVKQLKFRAAKDCWITSFTNQTGEEFKEAYYGIPIQPNDVFHITTDKIVRSEQVVVYIDDPSVATYGGSITFAYGTDHPYPAFQFITDNVPLEGGYHTAPFNTNYDNDVYITATFLTARTFYAYKNDLPLDIEAPLSLTDRDVLKVYLEKQPENLTVTFGKAADVAEDFTEVIRDLIVPVNTKDPLNVLTGTEIKFRFNSETTITANDIVLTPNEDGIYTVIINENTEIFAGIKPIERNENLVVYVDNPSVATSGAVYFANGTADQFAALEFVTNGTYLEEGYHIIPFSSNADNPVAVSAQIENAQTFYLYHNDKQIMDAQSALTLADKDVLKVYLEKQPETLTVHFSKTEGTTAEFTNIVRDLLIPIENSNEQLSVLTGTELSFGLEAENKTVVTANGIVLTADNDGIYTVIINANTEIVAGGETSIENTQKTSQCNVYTLQGMLLLQDATQAQIDALHAGIYIINGKTTYLWQH